MKFNRNYGTGKYNECNENSMYSFICRLYQAIEYTSSKSGYLKIFKVKGKTITKVMGSADYHLENLRIDKISKGNEIFRYYASSWKRRVVSGLTQLCTPHATRIAWKTLPAGAMWDDYCVNNHPLSDFLYREELITSLVNLVKNCG